MKWFRSSDPSLRVHRWINFHPNKTGTLRPTKAQMNAYRVHFKVDELSAREGDNDLPSVDRALHDLLLSGRLPLVDPLVGPDVANAVRIDLDEGIVSERGAGEGRGSAQEA